MSYKVAALYRFVAVGDVPAACAAVKAVCLANDVCGTILIAPEGVNGTIAGLEQGIDAVIVELNRRFGIHQGEVKFSHATEKPFQRLKIRPKKEIVTLKQPQADPTKQVGTYVAPEDWNALISDPDIVVIDTRNIYETELGVFKGAIDPRTEHFSHFPDFVERHLDPARHKKIAMYCTGGIRCEKASSYMLSKGFETVFHLKGGILKYLENIPAENSLWNGSCFVFDERYALEHGLQETELVRDKSKP